MITDFKLAQTLPDTARELLVPLIKRSWVLTEFLSTFPNRSVAAMDLGAGDNPVSLRPEDHVTTVDFDSSSAATVCCDITQKWPFGTDCFDVIFMNHVLEHFYPRDRDRLVNKVHYSLKPGGFVFIRVPHQSSLQATGFEHHTLYGANGVTSLCHGRNPYLPVFRAVTTGYFLGSPRDFFAQRKRRIGLLEKLLNLSHSLTERFVASSIGGIPEVQFVLQKLPPECEYRFFPKRTPQNSSCRP